jgi:phosphoribosylformimino-5-aminoimidazole carboxamide ribotide isomerase
MIPCIDLMNGKVVQLVQGKNKALELELDKVIGNFNGYEKIQVIDLDAAMDKCNNYDLIKKISEKFNIRVGGGIRTIEKAKEILELGAEKLIIGSSVFKDNEIDYYFLTKLNKKISKSKIIIAIDSFKGNVMIKGWKENTNISIKGIIKKLEPYCSEFLATYIDKEGMMQGTNLDFFKQLNSLTNNKLTAAGGITTLEEVKTLEELNINSAVGMAFYIGELKP